MIGGMQDLYADMVRLRDELGAALVQASAPVNRLFVAPGIAAAWDDCCDRSPDGDGQAWVAVERVYPTDPFPLEVVEPMRCGPSEYAAALAVGVLRCAHTVDDRGRSPSAEKVTGDAEEVARDRQAALTAILCGFLPDADPGTWQLGQWTPLGPDGGCVGGLWRLTVAVGPCPC